jgi:peptide/nickel transport system substrate-binding protein
MNRRELLKLAAAGSAPAVTARPFRSARAQGPELVVGMSLDPGHLDPRVEAGVPGWSIFSHMFDGFVFRDERTNPIPWLVTKWEQVSPTVLRWHLRKAIRFHNGEDFTAESVKFSLEQYAAPTSRSPWKSRIGVIREHRIVDPHTIDLVTERPNRPLLRNSTSAMALSPRAFRELGERFPTNPVGTGAMKFVEYRPGQHVVMQAHPGYWGKKPAFSQMRFRFIPENGTRLAALEAGEVMVVNNVPPDQLPRLRANPNLRIVTSPTNRVTFIALRTDRRPFNDKRVRQALNHAIDREALGKGIMGGMAPVARAPLPAAVFGAHPSLPPYDPERAKKLLASPTTQGVGLSRRMRAVPYQPTGARPQPVCACTPLTAHTQVGRTLARLGIEHMLGFSTQARAAATHSLLTAARCPQEVRGLNGLRQTIIRGRPCAPAQMARPVARALHSRREDD